jgi:hypothetical protein
MGVEEILIGLFVAALDYPRNAVEIDCPQIDHGVRVAHLGCLQIAAHCQLPILLDPIATEVAVADFVLGCSVIALRGLDEVRYGFFGGFLHAEAMLMEDTQVEQGLSSITLQDL